jgi:hypothetical protein
MQTTQQALSDVLTYTKILSALRGEPLYVYTSRVGIHIECRAPQGRKYQKVRPDGTIDTYGADPETIAREVEASERRARKRRTA